MQIYSLFIFHHNFSTINIKHLGDSLSFGSLLMHEFTFMFISNATSSTYANRSTKMRFSQRLCKRFKIVIIFIKKFEEKMLIKLISCEDLISIINYLIVSFLVRNEIYTSLLTWMVVCRHVKSSDSSSPLGYPFLISANICSCSLFHLIFLFVWLSIIW